MLTKVPTWVLTHGLSTSLMPEAPRAQGGLLRDGSLCSAAWLQSFFGRGVGERIQED